MGLPEGYTNNPDGRPVRLHEVKRLSLRLSKSEWNVILRYAKRHDVSATEATRALIVLGSKHTNLKRR